MTKVVYRYPRIYWSLGYLLAIFPFGMSAMMLISYVFSSLFSLTGLLISCGIFIPLGLLSVRKARRFQTVYSPITTSEDGIEAPVFVAPGDYKSIIVGKKISWEKLIAISPIIRGDEAAQLGSGTTGVRLFTAEGVILINVKLPGFENLREQIEVRILRNKMRI